MCYYNGVKVTKKEYDRLHELEKTIANLSEGLAIYKGFDYNMIPAIKPVPGTHTNQRVEMQWGFLPFNVKTYEEVERFRKGYKDAKGIWHKPYTTLNATSEEILNKPFFRDAALHRRCLISSNGFYEWMHVQVVGKSGKLLKTPEKFPYLVQMRNEDEFYFAGIYNPWKDPLTGKIIDTVALLTTAANTVMKQIHNSKERMPTILPGDLAEAWLYKDLTIDDILDIANYQVASYDMIATPLNKEFLKSANPHEPVIYSEVPELVY